MSQWIEAVPIRSKDDAETALILQREWISRYGCSRRIRSDRGGEFLGKEFRRLLNTLHIPMDNSISHHPQTKVSLEPLHRTLKDRIHRGTEHPEDWELHIEDTLHSVRISSSRALGMPPFEFLFAQSPTLPIDHKFNLLHNVSDDIKDPDLEQRLGLFTKRQQTRQAVLDKARLHAEQY